MFTIMKDPYEELSKTKNEELSKLSTAVNLHNYKQMQIINKISVKFKF